MSDLSAGSHQYPTPRGRLPVIGHSLQLVGDVLATLERWAAEVGDLYHVDIPRRQTWVVNRPEEIERVLTHAQQFIKDKELRRTRPLMGDGLVTSEGDLWKKQRRMMQPAFHKERIAAYGQRMVALTEQRMSAWVPGQVRDVHNDAMALTLKIATDTLFGDDEVPADVVAESFEAVLRRFDGVRALLPSSLPFPRFRRFHSAIGQMEAVVYGVLSRRRAGKVSEKNLLSTLLDAQDEDGTGMSDRQLRDELITLLIAGHETVANTLTWTWSWLARHPEAERNFFDEVDALNGLPTAADMQRLPYTGAVLNESIRLRPAIWIISREVIGDWEIAGFPVERGTQVSMMPWIVHRDPRFFPEPLRFRPERWLDGSTKDLPDYAYFPFGGGQRLCIGRPFALLESVLVLATVAKRYRLRQVSDLEPVPLPSLTLRPRGGLPMRLERR